MRLSLLLSLPLLALVGCDGEPKPDSQDDTAIGQDDDTGGTTGDAELTLSAASLDLGTCAPGGALEAELTIGNEGTGPLQITEKITSGGGNFAVDASGFTISPGSSLTVTVSFTGDTAAVYAGNLRIYSNDADEGQVDVGLTATIGNDEDGDGYAEGDDCDDSDPSVNPGASETWYDGIDQDCDGGDDYDQDGDGSTYGEDCDDTDADAFPGNTETWYDGADGDCSGGSDYDQDGDGWDSDAYGGEDCDDLDANASPGLSESTGDGVDNDCDGEIDEGLSTEDLDGDGYSEATGDCDDTDAAINPLATEVWYDGIDQDCDGNDLDQDEDGYSLAYDCDDTNAAAYPSASEVWYDGVDNDCDGLSDYDQDYDGYDAADYGGDDCDDTDRTVSPGATDTAYDGIDSDCGGGSDFDVDGDGHDAVPYGGDDCDDRDATISPDAVETWYDGVDQDCDGASDYDADADGYDSDAYGGDDCDDTNAAANPGMTETWYDGIDGDCDGGSDYDRDGDGQESDDYGGTDCNDLDPNVYEGAAETWYDGVDSDCSGGSDYDQDVDGYTTDTYGGLDCDDLDASVNPAATEIWYDGIDQDCDGASDYDADGDGYTASSSGGTDCDDTSASVSPGATETCDGVDNDCDGSIDESGSTTTYYRDADGDGYGLSTSTTTSCGAPSGYVATSGDCNDGSSAVHPGATETCNSVDDDCDGLTDEGTTGSTYYRDADSDGYGDPDTSTTSCSGSVSGYVSDATDCDDTASTTWPGAPELCDGIDNDCDGTAESASGTEVSYNAADDDCDGYADDMLAEDESGWTVLGENSSDAIGSALEVADDLDGDGDPELMIGVTGYNYSSWYTDYGIVSFHDVDTDGLDQDVTDGYYELWGNSYDDMLGSAVQPVDDLDGDGYTEVAFGAYQANASSWTDDDAGIVYVYDVHSETGSDYAYTTYADAAVVGTATSGWYGYALASGDFDGDGMDDLAGGAPGEQTGKGRVYVTFDSDGLDSDVLDTTDSNFYTTGVSNYDYLGYSVAFGDFGGDGYDDLVACSPYDDDGGTNAGTCWVVNGASTRGSSSVSGTTVSSLDSAVITGSAASDYLGYAAHALSVGDIDDDGRDDLAVGVSGYDGATSGGGGAWIWAGAHLSGSETYATADYVVEGDGGLGTSVRFGDVTGDGVDDLLAGATTAGASYGVVYLFEGGQSAGTYTMPDDQYASWTGAASGDLFGAAISGVMDLDGDGRDEFAAAATANDDGASGAGKVYVIPAYP